MDLAPLRWLHWLQAGSAFGKQAGLATFFRATARCLGCKQAVSGVADGQLPPGLCTACAAQEGQRSSALITHMTDVRKQEERLAAASAQCLRCHSGGQHTSIACSNGECSVLYDRLGAARRLAAAAVRVQRLGIDTDGSPLEW